MSYRPLASVIQLAARVLRRTLGGFVCGAAGVARSGVESLSRLTLCGSSNREIDHRALQWAAARASKQKKTGGRKSGRKL